MFRVFNRKLYCLIELHSLREKMSEFNAARWRGGQVWGSRLRGTLAPAFSPGRVHAETKTDKRPTTQAREIRLKVAGGGRTGVGVRGGPGQRSRPTPGTPARTGRDLPGRSRRPQRPSVDSAAASSREVAFPSPEPTHCTASLETRQVYAASAWRMFERNKKKKDMNSPKSDLPIEFVRRIPLGRGRGKSIVFVFLISK